MLFHSSSPQLNFLLFLLFFIIFYLHLSLSLSLSLSISLYPSLLFFLFLSLSPQTLMKMLRDSTGDRLTLNPIFSATPSSHLHNSTLLLSYLFSFSLFSSARPHSSPILSFFFFTLLICTTPFFSYLIFFLFLSSHLFSFFFSDQSLRLSPVEVVSCALTCCWIGKKLKNY